MLLSVFVAALLANVILKPLIGRARPHPDDTAIMRALPPRATVVFVSLRVTQPRPFGGMIAVARMWPQGRSIWWSAALLIA